MCAERTTQRDGTCSLCGSPGTNKVTCPLNPQCRNPNFAAHPNVAGGQSGGGPAQQAERARAREARAEKTRQRKAKYRRDPPTDFSTRHIKAMKLFTENSMGLPFNENAIADFELSQALVPGSYMSWLKTDGEFVELHLRNKTYKNHDDTIEFFLEIFDGDMTGDMISYMYLLSYNNESGQPSHITEDLEVLYPATIHRFSPKKVYDLIPGQPTDNKSKVVHSMMYQDTWNVVSPAIKAKILMIDAIIDLKREQLEGQRPEPVPPPEGRQRPQQKPRPDPQPEPEPEPRPRATAQAQAPRGATGVDCKSLYNDMMKYMLEQAINDRVISSDQRRFDNSCNEFSMKELKDYIVQLNQVSCNLQSQVSALELVRRTPAITAQIETLVERKKYVGMLHAIVITKLRQYKATH